MEFTGETSDAFLVTPALWPMVFALLWCVGAAITAAKGRWGWLAAGLLTGGLTFPVSVFLTATPGSVWARVFYGPTRMARARRMFPHLNQHAQQ